MGRKNIILFVMIFGNLLFADCIDDNRTDQGTSKIINGVCETIPLPYLPENNCNGSDNRLLQGSFSLCMSGIEDLNKTAYIPTCSEGQYLIQGTVTCLYQKGIKKTGQTQSYDEVGMVVNDDSVKDDGFYQKGVPSHYTRDNIKETVTDDLTDLMWQDDIEVTKYSRVWYEFEAYCTSLRVGDYTDWRVPTVREISTLLNMANSPAIDQTFIYVGRAGSGFYTTSSKTVELTYHHWGIQFSNGSFNPRKNSRYEHITCVRNNLLIEDMK